MLRAVFAKSPVRPLRVLHVKPRVSDTSSRKAHFASQQVEPRLTHILEGLLTGYLGERAR
jgi:hypothetical protein